MNATISAIVLGVVGSLLAAVIWQYWRIEAVALAIVIGVVGGVVLARIGNYRKKKKSKKPEIFKQQTPHPPLVSLEMPDNYKNWVISQCQRMDISKLVDTRDPHLIKLELPDIYIPLYTNPPEQKKESREDRPDIGERQEPLDIEELAASSDYLVVRGQAGSGKTTLMKHIAYSIMGNSEQRLKGYLPLLVFLRDVPNIIPPKKGLVAGAQAAEKILTDYFLKKCNGLDIELIKAFCHEGRAIFLLDGLDEIEPELRKFVTDSFADFRTQFKQCKMVFSGRPHGVDATACQKFGDKCVDINSLNKDQVRLFIEKWLTWDTDLRDRGKTPGEMFAEIYQHPSFEELMRTPLMLTAACILYHYDMGLPEQRADLYERIINNLIYKRFPKNPVEVQDLLMKIAYENHSRREKAFGKEFALDFMMPERQRKRNETEDQYSRRIIEEFDHIEQNCGLLRLDKGAYSFWHLSFQEFLAARQIAERKRAHEHAQAIKSYWGDDWFTETLRLFIGYRSNSNRAEANGIVEDELGKPEESPFRHWREATKALLDIHPSKREKQTVAKAQSRLLEIINEEEDPKILADAGETLGWLGDPRKDLKDFVKIQGGQYELQELGRATIAPFEMGKYPVTNLWFEEFIREEGYSKKDYWTPEGWKWLNEGKYQEPDYWHDRKWKCPNSPVVGVSWYEADAFCCWLTITRKDGYTYRLPTEQEWQAAAAGKEGKEYPWGGWQENRCNTRESGIDKTSAVGVFLRGATPEGVADLAGNVWEWTCSDHESKEQRTDFTAEEFGPVLRGGSWNYDRGLARCSSRFWNYPNSRNYLMGFRCARI